MLAPPIPVQPHLAPAQPNLMDIEVCKRISWYVGLDFGVFCWESCVWRRDERRREEKRSEVLGEGNGKKECKEVAC